MFWRKKEKIEVELDTRHSDNRAAYRIAPDDLAHGVLAIIRYDCVNSVVTSE